MNVAEYFAGLFDGFWRGWYACYARTYGPATIELMKQRRECAKAMGYR